MAATIEQLPGAQVLPLECPECGCPGKVLARPAAQMLPNRAGNVADDWWISPGKARCEWCGREFPFTEGCELSRPNDHSTKYLHTRCPRCGSAETRVTSSPVPRAGDPRVRWHKCDQCAHRFKSVEPAELATAEIEVEYQQAPELETRDAI